MSAQLTKVTKTGSVSLLKKVSDVLHQVARVDPRDRYCLVYPDADRAFIGMGFKLLNIPASEKVYQSSSELVKKDLLKLCLGGSPSELFGSIENRNLATYVTTHATLTKLLSEKPEVEPFCKISVGIGVGFVNALVFHGAMKYEDGLELVQYQGRAMDRASQMIPSARIRLRIKPATSKLKVCRAAREHCLKIGIPPELAICSVTKLIKPHSFEICGHEEAIKYLETEGLRLFEFYKIHRIRKTPQAVHTEAMRPAELFLEGYIDNKMKENSNYLQPADDFTLYSSVTGFRLRRVERIKQDLVKYPVKPVKVEQVFHRTFTRPASLPQPSTFVLWDKKTLSDLEAVNRRAAANASLVEA